MINPFQRTDVVTIKDDFALKFVPVLLNLVMLHHDDDHIDVGEELVEIVVLVLHDIILNERIVDLERTSKMALLTLKHLECWRLTEVIDVLLVGKTIKADATVVGDVVLLHDLIDAIEDELWLRIVGLHTLVNHLSETWIIAYEEPRIDGNAVATYARTRLKDVHTWVHVADLDDLIHVHIVMTADACEFVSECNVHSAEGVLYHLGHLGGADVGDDDLALAERGVQAGDPLSRGAVVGADGAVVVQQLIDHVTGNDTLWSMYEVDVLTNLETILFNDWTYEVIHCAR